MDFDGVVVLSYGDEASIEQLVHDGSRFWGVNDPVEPLSLVANRIGYCYSTVRQVRCTCSATRDGLARIAFKLLI